MHTFIDNIITFSLRNKFFIFFCTTIAVIAGITSFIHTPIDAFPDVTNTKVTIITQWPGRSAEEIEKFITIPIEIAMNPVQKKTDIRSTTLFGLSVINVMFEDKVDDFFARQQVYNLLNDADLPEGVTPEVQPLYGPTGEIFRYTLRSDKRSVRELKTLQDWVIERKLRAVPGVADIVSFGGEVKTFEVSVNPNQLISYGVTTLELYDAIAKSNINVGGDVITKSSQAYVVRGIGLINDVKEIENIVVKNINGTPILVKHLATVHESSLPRLGQVGRMEEDDVVQGIVVMRKGENPGEVIAALKDKIKDIQQNALPEDVRIVSFYDRENLVDLAVKTVTHNLAEGILLVTFIVLIFMADWRTTVIVSIIIPLALLFAFICLRAMGMSANLLSMGAIDFGIIIDGAVVTLVFYWVSTSYISRLYYSYLTEKAYATAQKHWEKDETDDESYARIQQRYEETLPVATEILLNADSLETRQVLSRYLDATQVRSLYQEDIVHFKHDTQMGAALYYPDNEGNFIVIVLSGNQYGMDIQHRIGWLLLGLILVSSVLIYFVGRLYATRMVDRIDAAYQSEKAFISNASHELNNPLTAIQGECEISLLKERSPEEYQAALRRIATETSRIIQLIKHLLFLSHGDKEIQKSAMETIFLADFLMQFSSARISFSPDNFSYMISANPYLLKIAIKNILSNACKYSDDKSVEMRLRGSVLTISDRGIGIPPEELKRIFQPFYRASNTREYAGHGVGLSLSLRILSTYGAKVNIISDLGVGTSVEIDFG